MLLQPWFKEQLVAVEIPIIPAHPELVEGWFDRLTMSGLGTARPEPIEGRTGRFSAASSGMLQVDCRLGWSCGKGRSQACLAGIVECLRSVFLGMEMVAGGGYASAIRSMLACSRTWHHQAIVLRSQCPQPSSTVFKTDCTVM